MTSTTIPDITKNTVDFTIITEARREVIIRADITNPAMMRDTKERKDIIIRDLIIMKIKDTRNTVDMMNITDMDRNMERKEDMMNIRNGNLNINIKRFGIKNNAILVLAIFMAFSEIFIANNADRNVVNM